MAQIDDMATAALNFDALTLRSLAHDWLQENKQIDASMPPASQDVSIRNVAAGLVEMFAERLGQSPPAWAAQIPPVSRPIYLLKAAQTMRRLRQLCDSESPLPLRRRNLLAPPTFLEFA
jgi:hypothetical protein